MMKGELKRPRTVSHYPSDKVCHFKKPIPPKPLGARNTLIETGKVEYIALGFIVAIGLLVVAVLCGVK